MPELPEVETVRRSLESTVVGKTIAAVSVRLARIVRTPADLHTFERLLQGCTVYGVSRRGKYLLFDLGAYTLISHLRMEGQYRFAEQADDPEPTHTHVVFAFADGSALRYRDVRQFGTMDLLAKDEPLLRGVTELGPEPFDPALTPERLHKRVHARTAPIKAVLLDQSCLAGLGNIYVDEALFAAGLHPELPANRLTKAQAATLLREIRDVLERAIVAGGSSIKTYVDGYGRHGGFQIALSVYGRTGQSCMRCGVPVEKMRVAGRGTHVCPNCQKRPRRSPTAHEKRSVGKRQVAP